MGDRTRCPNRVRHCFTVYGQTRNRLPRCVLCGAPNPGWPEAASKHFDGDGECPRCGGYQSHMDWCLAEFKVPLTGSSAPTSGEEK